MRSAPSPAPWPRSRQPGRHHERLLLRFTFGQRLESRHARPTLLTISKGLSSVGNGGLLYLRGGAYVLTNKLSLSKTANPTYRIRIWATRARRR